MGERIRRFWSPTHHLILYSKLNPLGGSVGTYVSKTVLLLVLVTNRNSSFEENLVAEIGAKSFL